jgi:hypothetical protein
MGPETYNDLGNETYLSANRLPKGTGIEHLRDSNITDTGTVVSVNSNTAVTGSFTVVSGSAVELQVTNLGVNIGSALTDAHIVSGSLTINPNGLFVSGSGNVGIGTTSPAQKLQINGPLALSNLAEDFTTNQEYAYPIIYASNLSGLGNGELVIQPRTTATRSIRFVTRSSGAVSGTNPDTRMIIRWDGNVGIGTNSPNIYNTANTKNLTVVSDAGYGIVSAVGLVGSGGEIDLGSTTIRHAAIASLDGSNLGFYTNGTNSGTGVTERMRITSGGNVGIGTTNPTTYSLNGRHFELNDAGGGYSFIHNNTTTVKSFYAINEASLLAALFTFSNHPLTLGTNNTERMRITSDGYTRLSASSGGIQFNGDTAAANALDDYEEGSFTPSHVGTTFSTVTPVFGRYIKIGNQVTINCRWDVTLGSTGIHYLVFDLPFAFVNNSNISFTATVSNYNGGLSSSSSNVGTSVRNSSGSTTQQYVEAYYTTTSNNTLHLSMTYFTFF